MNNEHRDCVRDLELRHGYTSSTDDLLRDFYQPIIGRAVSYDRAVGYFSSGLLALAPLAYEKFVLGQGKMRLVCSPHISPQDAERLRISESPVAVEPKAVAAQVRALADSSDLADALTIVMSSFLAAGILKMKFAVGHSGALFHDKVGILRDQCGHSVSFVGSANETAAAWSGFGNHEQIEAFYEWQSGEQEDRVRRHRRQFEEIWHDLARGLKVQTADESAAIIYDVRSPEAPDLAVEHLAELRDKRRPTSGVYVSGERRSLRKHQISVLDSWDSENHSGLVAFATGGGKTLVGIEAVRRWTNSNRPALILVPSTLLHKQWMAELGDELPDIPVLQIGAGRSRTQWLSNLRTATEPDTSYGPRLVLSTYQTAATEDFLSRIQGGEHLLVVADEVHRMGATDTRRLFGVEAGGRLGLSATPDRYGDPDGTEAIHSYFGLVLEPRFGITEAIKTGQLVPYDYYLETVEFENDELERWDAFSKAMAQEIARNNGAMTDRAIRLARDRARLLKSASGKAALARRVLQSRFTDGDHWLIYCDTLTHLKSVREAIDDLGVPIYEYHSQSSYLGPEIFRHFSKGGVLLAIKCLDEGVDLPFINKALILASTSNPREYIQRRGRVLRRYDNKHYATIVDAAVTDSEGVLMSLGEATRASEFAGEAQNRAGKFKLDALTRQAASSDRWRRDETVFEQDGEDDV